MTVANSTTVEGAEHMKAALDRQQGRPLITVCNHVASLDDPLVMSTILPPELYSDASQLRWATMTALLIKEFAAQLPGRGCQQGPSLAQASVQNCACYKASVMHLMKILYSSMCYAARPAAAPGGIANNMAAVHG